MRNIFKLLLVAFLACTLLSSCHKDEDVDELLAGRIYTGDNVSGGVTIGTLKFRFMSNKSGTFYITGQVSDTEESMTAEYVFTYSYVEPDIIVHINIGDTSSQRFAGTVDDSSNTMTLNGTVFTRVE